MKFDIERPVDPEVTITLTLREVRIIEEALDWATDNRSADTYDTEDAAIEMGRVWNEFYLFLELQV
jgi:hypothetical protein